MSGDLLWPNHKSTPELPADAASNLERIADLEVRVKKQTFRIIDLEQKVCALLECFPGLDVE